MVIASPEVPAVALVVSPTSAKEVLPIELDALTPLVGRGRELHWLRGTWRQARRGEGRIVLISGPAGIGKTRLAAELAAEIAARVLGRIHYAGSGGAAAAEALRVLHEAAETTEPTFVVLDDLDALGDAVLNQLAVTGSRVAARPVLVAMLAREPASLAALSTLIESEDAAGDRHRALGPLVADAVTAIARSYIEDPSDVPVDAMVKASGGLPGTLHELVATGPRTRRTGGSPPPRSGWPLAAESSAGPSFGWRTTRSG